MKGDSEQSPEWNVFIFNNVLHGLLREK